MEVKLKVEITGSGLICYLLVFNVQFNLELGTVILIEVSRPIYMSELLLNRGTFG